MMLAMACAYMPLPTVSFNLLIVFTHIDSPTSTKSPVTQLLYYLSHMFTHFLDFQKYFPVSYITVSNFDNIMIIILFIINMVQLLIAFVKNIFHRTKGRLKWGEVIRFTNWLHCGLALVESSTCRHVQKHNSTRNSTVS